MTSTNPLVPVDPEFELPDGYDKVYNPALRSDEVGPNRHIPKGYEQETPLAHPYCNYDGYAAGRTTIIQQDELKIIRNTVNSVPIVYAEDFQTIDGMNGSERI